MAITKTSSAVIALGTSNAAFTQLTGCSATRSGTTATLTKTSHGLSNGDTVLIQGFSLSEFNGIFTIGNVATNTFDYTIAQDPGANPTGTPATVDKVTLGTYVNLTTVADCVIFGGLQNTTTGPTVAPKVWVGVSDSANEYDFIWRELFSGDTVANSWSAFSWRPGFAVSYANVAVCRNTGQAVDCFATAMTATN